MTHSFQFPCGQSRREWIWQAGCGFAGLSLLDLLSSENAFGFPSEPTESPPESPQAKSQPNHFATNRRPGSKQIKSCIFLTMNGAPSQVDTFDYKPALRKYAGKTLPKDKTYINSGGRKVGYLTPEWRAFRPGGESGLLVSDYFPRIREHADKLCVLNSCHTDSHAHGSALVAMNTGKTQIGRPSLGSWTVYGLGSENEDLPGYVVMLDNRGGPISGQANWSSGFMPASHAGTPFRSQGQPILDLDPPESIRGTPQKREFELLRKLNQTHASQRDIDAKLLSRMKSYELAYRMQSAAPEAVDLSQESAETLRAYGVGSGVTNEYGRNCLIARRLVERGVRFVQLYSGGGHLEETWDAHESIEKNHGQHAAEVDQPIAALLEDLHQRGLLEETLVIWGGEFGRMPFSEGKDAPGRNHNPYGYSMWLAGGGVRGGMNYGETDELGFEAVTNRVHLHDLHATILHLMGLDHERLTYFYQGRNESLTDVGGRVLDDILA